MPAALCLELLRDQPQDRCHRSSIASKTWTQMAFATSLAHRTRIQIKRAPRSSERSCAFERPTKLGAARRSSPSSSAVSPAQCGPRASPSTRSSSEPDSCLRESAARVAIRVRRRTSMRNDRTMSGRWTTKTGFALAMARTAIRWRFHQGALCAASLRCQMAAEGQQGPARWAFPSAR